MFTFIKSSLHKLHKALSKTRSILGFRIRALFGKPWDESTFELLEQILYEADLGHGCAQDFIDHLKQELRLSPTNDIEKILSILHKRALSLLNAVPPKELSFPKQEPLVILIVGINGSGKTTTIAKLAKLLQKEGRKVLLAAGDTFRAAAIEQLTLWAERLSIDIIKSKPGSDPSAVAFDAISAAKARQADVVLIDTAGRLQNKKDLMQELEKIKRVCSKLVPSAPQETLLILDATTGQNAVDQAETFHQYTPLTGLVLTKLDGSAKGGIILAIYQKLKIPVRWVGVGEGSDDLLPFDAKEYVDALFEN